RMGFSDPPVVAASIRAWHHGRIGATRSARGRELFTRLAPRLLETAAASGAPDQAFQRFALFFAGLSAGVLVQELLLAQPRLLALIVDVLALAPRLAAVLARRPAALDAILDAPFFAPVADDSGVLDQLASEVEAATDFEGAMNAARRIHREQVFRIGVHLIEGRADATAAGEAYTDLAHGCIRTLAGAALKETWRQGGAFEGRAAVVALGRAGSREMTATSDLDLMVVYDAPEGAASAGKGWSADQVYVRFTQRLIAALSAPTAEGDLYAVDMRLRPTGAKGPVAVRLSALADYYRTEAQTWELLALTRGRVVWASDEAFAAQTAAVIEQALRAPIDAASARLDVAEMRALMARQRPARGAWDLKLAPGGLVDCEFAAQLLQLLHAGDGGPLSPSAPEALRRLAADGRFDATQAEALIAAWRLQQDLDQLIRCALGAGAAPTAEPEGFRRRLAAWGGAGDFAALERLLAERRAAARAVFERLTDAATDW
ncbi:MAG TPA: glutamine-synthetase adenylyltransferase, partial [Caulobacteraceae bacterium]